MNFIAPGILIGLIALFVFAVFALVKILQFLSDWITSDPREEGKKIIFLAISLLFILWFALGVFWE